jgi:hypothetical protein
VRVAVGAGTVLALLLVGCSSARSGPSRSPSSPSVAAADRPACAQLFASLQRVSAALQASSELIATSLGTQQLSERIAVEEDQLRKSARLIADSPVPPSLAPAAHELVSALQTYTADFARARTPAAQGDFQAAANAMTDHAAVQRILDASTTIESACG